MSFNGADSADGATLNPSSNLGGSSGYHEITPGDIAVIVGAVVVFALVVFAVFYYRQLQVRRKRAEDLMELGAVGEEDGVDKKPPIWKFISWKEPKEMGAGAGTAPDVRHGESINPSGFAFSICDMTLGHRPASSLRQTLTFHREHFR